MRLQVICFAKYLHINIQMCWASKVCMNQQPAVWVLCACILYISVCVCLSLTFSGCVCMYVRTFIIIHQSLKIFHSWFSCAADHCSIFISSKSLSCMAVSPCNKIRTISTTSDFKQQRKENWTHRDDIRFISKIWHRYTHRHCIWAVATSLCIEQRVYPPLACNSTNK